MTDTATDRFTTQPGDFTITDKNGNVIIKAKGKEDENEEKSSDK